MFFSKKVNPHERLIQTDTDYFISHKTKELIRKVSIVALVLLASGCVVTSASVGLGYLPFIVLYGTLPVFTLSLITSFVLYLHSIKQNVKTNNIYRNETNNPTPSSETNNPTPSSETNNPTPSSETNNPTPSSETNNQRILNVDVKDETKPISQVLIDLNITFDAFSFCEDKPSNKEQEKKLPLPPNIKFDFSCLPKLDFSCLPEDETTIKKLQLEHLIYKELEILFEFPFEFYQLWLNAHQIDILDQCLQEISSVVHGFNQRVIDLEKISECILLDEESLKRMIDPGKISECILLYKESLIRQWKKIDLENKTTAELPVLKRINTINIGNVSNIIRLLEGYNVVLKDSVLVEKQKDLLFSYTSNCLKNINNLILDCINEIIQSPENIESLKTLYSQIITSINTHISNFINGSNFRDYYKGNDLELIKQQLTIDQREVDKNINLIGLKLWENIAKSIPIKNENDSINIEVNPSSSNESESPDTPTLIELTYDNINNGILNLESQHKNLKSFIPFIAISAFFPDKKMEFQQSIKKHLAIYLSYCVWNNVPQLPAYIKQLMKFCELDNPSTDLVKILKYVSFILKEDLKSSSLTNYNMLLTKLVTCISALNRQGFSINVIEKHFGDFRKIISDVLTLCQRNQNDQSLTQDNHNKLSLIYTFLKLPFQ